MRAESERGEIFLLLFMYCCCARWYKLPSLSLCNMHTARGASRIFGFVRWRGHHLTLRPKRAEAGTPNYLMLLGPCALCISPRRIVAVHSADSIVGPLRVWRFSHQWSFGKRKVHGCRSSFRLTALLPCIINFQQCAMRVERAGSRLFCSACREQRVELPLSLVRRKCISDTCWLDLTAAESVIRLSL
jgi:hypothetical protein